MRTSSTPRSSTSRDKDSAEGASGFAGAPELDWLAEKLCFEGEDLMPDRPRDASPPEVEALTPSEIAPVEPFEDPALTAVEDPLPEEDAQTDETDEDEHNYLDDLQRLQAEFENYKKRMMRQQTEHLVRAAESLVDKLLPVLDAGDLAMAHGGEEAEATAQVVGMLYDTLRKEGLEALGVKPGDAFDPNEHDAVAHEPGDDSAPAIAEVLREGYRWKGRLLRPAMVRVRG